MSAKSASAITSEEFLGVLHASMPEVRDLDLRIDRLVRGEITVRLAHDDRRLRPGGTISGPTVFMLADLALYGVTMSIVGLEPLAVTTDVTIHFLRKPPPAALVCTAKVLKAGKRLVIGEAHVASETRETSDESALVAHVVGTYSVPPRS
jgi:uncharacterized protein (TIGR00369 family)